MAGGLFAFLTSFDNVPVSIFLTTARNNTLPVTIMSYLVNQDFDAIVGAISAVQVGMVLVLLYLLDRIYGVGRLTSLRRAMMSRRPPHRGRRAARAPQAVRRPSWPWNRSTCASAPGEFVSLLGPSGCGKTTTLRAIAGLVRPDCRQVIVGGRVMNDVPVHRRGLGLVAQNYALFPHMTVFENVTFGLRMRGVPAAEIARRAQEALATVQLAGLESRYPRQLSGGQQQRVALARCLVVEPDVLLLDEPLGALDKKLRETMQVELKSLQRQVGITTIFVTHDQEEALTMSDRIAVMHQGRLQQVGTPQEIYEAPQNRFVAEFVGGLQFPGRSRGRARREDRPPPPGRWWAGLRDGRGRDDASRRRASRSRRAPGEACPQSRGAADDRGATGPTGEPRLRGDGCSLLSQERRRHAPGRVPPERLGAAGRPAARRRSPRDLGPRRRPPAPGVGGLRVRHGRPGP